jgi:hypothetical protein
MSEKTNNPAKSTDPEVLRKYFVDTLGLTPEEAEPMIKNWSRTEPQSMEEVRAGVQWERENRLASSEKWASQLKQSGGQKAMGKGE